MKKAAEDRAGASARPQPKNLLCGLHAVRIALQHNPKSVLSIWVNDQRLDRLMDEIMQVARGAAVPVEKVARDQLDRLVPGVRHQGVVAQVRQARRPAPGDLATVLANVAGLPLLLILDGVQDPHNLGACLRSADAAGAHGVIVPQRHSAPLSAVARRAASGAAESIPLIEAPNLARCLRDLKARGIWVIGAAEDADQDLYEADLNRPLALVLGGEGSGLRRLTRELCDLVIRLPMYGAVESLNVSVAAGICLYETVRQRLNAKCR